MSRAVTSVFWIVQGSHADIAIQGNFGKVGVVGAKGNIVHAVAYKCDVGLFSQAAGGQVPLSENLLCVLGEVFDQVITGAVIVFVNGDAGEISGRPSQHSEDVLLADR